MNKETNGTFLENFVGVLIASTILFVIITLFGRLALTAFEMPLHSIFYNFIIGIGILATITFIISIIEELRR